MHGTNLLNLQLGDFLATSPDDGAPGRVRLHHEQDSSLDLAAQNLDEHLDNKHRRVVVVVQEDDIVRRQSSGPNFFLGDRFGRGEDGRGDYCLLHETHRTSRGTGRE